MYRYLCNIILYNGEIYYNSIISITNQNIEITPFDQELHSTIFLSGCLILYPKHTFTKQDKENIFNIFNFSDDIKSSAIVTNNYILNNDLIFSLNKTDNTISDAGFMLCTYNSINDLDISI